jgi:uncharacterized membrane protein YphA (DoxX/SURF4 family)
MSFSLFAPVFIRIFLGVCFIITGSNLLRVQRQTVLAKSTWIMAGIVSLGTGSLLFVGAYTQIAALIGGLFAFVALLLKKEFPTVFSQTRALYGAVIFMCLSLLFSGSGFLGFDFPL